LAGINFAAADGNILVIITADHETGGFFIIGGDMKTGTLEGVHNGASHRVMILYLHLGQVPKKFSIRIQIFIRKNVRGVWVQ
jgi:alkaline phosphatase